MANLRLIRGEDQPDLTAEPRPYECVACFLDRVIRMHGCDNQLTWALRWRDRRAPRATALRRRLEAHGGFCDCEVLMNVYARPEWLRGQWDDADQPVVDDRDVAPPPCFGVRKGSTQVCAHWTSPY